MKPKISLHRLFLTLLSPIASREYVALPEEEIAATTIRLEPEVRRYYDDAAKELGLSLQAIIKIALTGLMKVSQNETKTEINLIIDRFFEVFAANRIPTVDIPKFLLPYKISLSALAHEDRLLDILEPDFLSHIAKLFNINLGWLKGLSGHDSTVVSNEYKWYKAPVVLCQYLNELSHQGFQPELLFVSDSSRKKMYEDRLSGPNGSASVGIMLRAPKKTESGILYNYFEVYEHGPWGHEKTRIDLKVVMMFCVRNNFDVRGMIVEKPDFGNLFSGNVLPITIYEKCKVFWEPIDYVSAGYNGDTDIDELLTVIEHYCEHDKITEYCENKGKPGRTGMWGRFSINLDNYKYGVTKSIDELLDEAGKKFLIASNVS